MNAPLITLVVARDAAGGIGIDNRLPWHLPEDLKHFKAVTMGKPILMGRKTWESLGRPLPGRRNVVVSRTLLPAEAPGAEVFASLDEALAACADVPEACVIGGAQLFAAALPRVNRAIITEIGATFPADTFLPALDAAKWREVSRVPHVSASGLAYEIATYDRG